MDSTASVHHWRLVSVVVAAGSVLESFLDGELYEARKCAHISQHLSDVIIPE